MPRVTVVDIMLHMTDETDTRPPKQRAYESRLRERGGKRLPGGTLQPDAAAALAALLGAGYAPSATACIARALIEAAGRESGVAE